jgi:hypothetical protein
MRSGACGPQLWALALALALANLAWLVWAASDPARGPSGKPRCMCMGPHARGRMKPHGAACWGCMGPHGAAPGRMGPGMGPFQEIKK